MIQALFKTTHGHIFYLTNTSQKKIRHITFQIVTIHQVVTTYH